jgi:hypothetical protein
MIFGLVFNDLVTEKQECTSTAADGNLMDGTHKGTLRAYQKLPRGPPCT